MCKEGWCARLGQEWVMRVWGNCLKQLKNAVKQKTGQGKKDFKKGEQAESQPRCLKMGGEGGGGCWNPLTNYEWISNIGQ